MTRSSALLRDLRRNPKTLASKRSPKRRLRAEWLEPRMMLSTTTTSLLASANAYTEESLPVCNFGGSTSLLVENVPTTLYDSYLKFNLSALSGQVITSATLQLTPTMVGGNASVSELQVQLVSAAAANAGWTEGSGGFNYGSSGAITWENQPTTFTGQPVSAVAGSKLAMDQALQFNVTSLVQQQFLGSSNTTVGFAVSPVGASVANLTNWVDFASRENTTEVNGVYLRPTLVVTSAPASLTITPTAPSTVTGTSTGLSLGSVTFTQTAKQDTNALSVLWAASSSPSGAATPTFSNANSTSPTVTFYEAGSYTFLVQVVDSAGNGGIGSVSLTVNQTLASTSAVTVSPSGIYMSSASTQNFTATGTDQFGNSMALTSQVAWSAGAALGGTFSSTTPGLYTAPTETGTKSATGTVTATVGKQSGSAGVTVTYLGIQDSALATEITNLVGTTNPAITRAEMITILNYVDGGTLATAPAAAGAVSAEDLADLKTLIGASDAAALKMPGYVQVLAGDAINDTNEADAHYLGKSLATLTGGASGSATVLWDLTEKWFLGTDLPVANGASNPNGSNLSYASYASDPLFDNENGVNSIPLYTDTHQYGLGDCYFLSTMASIAKANPTAIENMFINNGDGTYTVRFYTANGTPDYVTVNTMLPVYQGSLFYAMLPTNNDGLWMPLAEKAYAEWDETGNSTSTNWDGVTGAAGNFGLVTRQSLYPGVYANSYATIEGGWGNDVANQVLDAYSQTQSLTSPTAEYWWNATTGQSTQLAAQLKAALAVSTDAVTICTDYDIGDPNAASGLYESHCYIAISYNTTAGTFQLYNPWGMDQPNQSLTWGQLVAQCDNFSYVSTTSVPGPITSPATIASSSTLGLTRVAFSVAPGAAAGAESPSAVTTGASDAASAAAPTATSGSSSASDQVSLPSGRAHAWAFDWQTSDSVTLHDRGQDASGLSADAVDAILASGSVFQKTALV